MFGYSCLTDSEASRTDALGWLESTPMATHGYNVGQEYILYMPSGDHFGDSVCITDVTSWLGADYALED